MKINSFNGIYRVSFNKRFIENQKFKYFYIVDKFFENKNLYINKSRAIYIKANEENKSYLYVSTVISKLLKKNIDKKCIIVCIGGGVVQDIASFVSSILFRGIKWVYIPTTLSAQSDSCIGSKISINLGALKNIIGGYYPPQKVIINISFIKTLKNRDILSGFGEMGHYFYLSNKEDFIFFVKKLNNFIAYKDLDIDNLIYKSLKIKKYYIEKDELEKNIRIFLNYGHSFGHAIESLTDFKIPHGIAVSYGLQIANFVSHKLGFLSEKKFLELSVPLRLISRNYKIDKFDVKKIISFLKKDKKSINGKIRVILIKKIGSPFIKEFNDTKILSDYLMEFKKNYL